MDSKIPFTPNCGSFCEENFLRYLDLCFVKSVYHKFKAFPLTNQKLQDIVFTISATFGVKGILLLLVLQALKTNSDIFVLQQQLPFLLLMIILCLLNYKKNKAIYHVTL